MTLFLSYLGNMLWQWPLLGAAAALLARTARPRTAYLLWLAALGLGVLLPLGSALRVAPAAVAPATAHGGVQSASVAAPRTDGTNIHPRPEAAPPQPRDALATNAALTESVLRDADRIRAVALVPVAWLARPHLDLPRALASCLALGWVAVMLWGAGRLLLRWRATYRLLALAQPLELPAMQIRELEACARAFGVRPPPLAACAVASPALAGLRRPTLLLPPGFAERTEFERRAIFAHELAHLRRRDPWTHLLAELLALPLLWHPCTPWLLGQLNCARELATDELASRRLRSPHRYAACLVALAQSMLPGDAPQPASLGLFQPSFLEKRVMHLVQPVPALPLLRRIPALAAGVLLAGTATAFAASSPVALAIAPVTQAQTPAPAPSISSPAPAAPPAPSPAPRLHPQPSKGKHVQVTNHDTQPMTAAQQQQFEQQMQAMKAQVREQVEQSTAYLRSPEFKQQMAETSRINADDIRKQVEQSTAYLRSPEFKQQMAEASRVNADDIRKQVEQATAYLRSPEYQRQLRLLAQAESSGALEGQIQALHAQIAALQAQLAQRGSQPVRPSR